MRHADHDQFGIDISSTLRNGLLRRAAHDVDVFRFHAGLPRQIRHVDRKLRILINAEDLQDAARLRQDRGPRGAQ